MLLTWIVQLTLMIICVSAFYPFSPPYKCIEQGGCLGNSPKHNVDGLETRREVMDMPTLKIRQRLRRGNIPHDVRIGSYLARLTEKFSSSESSVAKRSNTYSIVTAAPPTQTNSVALNQDGTDYSYFATVNFGSNATPLYMLIDTGASATWVMSTSCKSPACLVHNTFGPTNSKTYSATSGLFDIAYGTGHVSGAVATDSVSFAGFTLSLSFGVANQTSDDFLHFPFDGIMGLARDSGSYPTVLEAMLSAKVLKSNIFGVNLDRNSDGLYNGEINFGAPDSSKYSGDLSYTALSSPTGGWVVAVDSVGVDGKSAGVSGRSAYIDTGTSYIFIPPADAEALHVLISGSQLSSDGGIWYVPCTTTSPIQFTFSGVTYSVPSEDWVGGKDGGSLCTSNIYPGTPVGTNGWLLGDTFMKNVYTVFDADKNRIGFGIKSIVSPKLTTTAAISSATSSTSKYGPLVSNTISTGPSPTNASANTPNPNSTVVASGGAGSSGFNAAIASSSISAAAATVSSSATTMTAAQGSAGSRFELYTSSLFAILFATIAIVT